MRSSLGSFLAAPLLLGTLAGVGSTQTTVFSENFESGGLGAYTETDEAGVPATTLWHGENECGPPFVPPGPPTDLLFTPSGGSYAVTNTPPAFASIAGTPGAYVAIPSGSDDTTTGPIPRFMPFTFFGSPKTLVQVSANGFLAFDQILGNGFASNAALPNTASPNDIAAPWWDDLHTGAAGAVWVLFNFGNQVIVEWNGVEHDPSNGSGETATFQVRLNGSPANTIEFHYDHAGFLSGADPWTATVGLEDAAGIAAVDATPNGNANALFPNIGGAPVPDLLPPSMGTNAAAYNQGDLGVFHFQTGAANDGAIETPLLASSPSGDLRIDFDYRRQTETGTSFDQCFVETKPAGGAWGVVTQVTGQAPCNAPTTVTSLCVGNVSPGTSLQQRFRFDTVDGAFNDYLGWYVDNVSITQVGGTGTFNPVLAEDFEGAGLGAFVETDVAGVPAATLWHGEGSCDAGIPIPAAMQTKAAAYNQGDIGLYNFATGGANEGAIESPAVATGPPITALRLQFDYAKETETSLTFDQCFVQVSPGAAGGWTTVTQLPGATVLCAGTPSNVTIGGPCDPALNTLVGAGGGKFRFFFDTVDGVANAGHGWYVDNVLLEGASPGGTVPYGTGCAGSGGVIPVVGATGLPQTGNFGFAVNLSSALAGTSTFLVLGVSDQSWLGFPLPLNLAFVQAPACFLNASVDILFTAATSPAGTASQILPIPNLPSLVGASLFGQWGVVDPGAAGPLPLAMTRGLRITIF